jgi:hypothetical protein
MNPVGNRASAHSDLDQSRAKASDRGDLHATDCQQS